MVDCGLLIFIFSSSSVWGRGGIRYGNHSGYYQYNSGFFGGHPNEIAASDGHNDGYVAFGGEFHAANDEAGFRLTPLNNPNCIDDPQHQLGFCYEAKFTYSTSRPFPEVEISEVTVSNSQPCKNCSLKLDNRNNITVTINTSVQ